MKAVVHKKYGSPDILQLIDMKKPVPSDDEVLIKIYATSVNRTDCASLRGKPLLTRVATGIFKPKLEISGSEFSGIVEETGKNVTSLKKGDKVFGFDDQGLESHGEYMKISEEKAFIIPKNISVEQATAGIEGVHYAYNFINKVDLKAGQRVLVNGATGAIGSSAVQLLKYFKVHVTAVCSEKNINLVKSLGADEVIDYISEDFTKSNQKFQYVFDTVGKSSFFKCGPILKNGGVYISSDLGYMAQNLFLPFITPFIKFLFKNKKTAFPFPANIKRSILLIRKLIEEEKFHAVVDRSYTLEEISEAYKYVEKGEKLGNVIITVVHSDFK
ncbi:NAD(P)-dependent alcohol dehydrogenase [Ilyobacter polytropus]|uniref:Alcohol dehydrogenase zinc-binding domain protein n=1 Tax=Ilyobacter polytropus (strain ATCC 51220 / DSM 2926 / LMG 16218 / CuHBu1) TaxID=572544 RepID=E3H8G2_ILYPC|nr:NAD(P)-dependent alcohol dehydrogenase [Ilyobacter polytropus]ADO82729.1 Alcohol dehydrogenase zinc-binding domain protein [Ilyobacter polytropus DSM 2926]